MRKIIFILLVLFPAFAYAISITEARSSGMIAENDHGYIEAVNNSPEIQNLVNEVNTKRRVEYQKIADNTGTSLRDVETLSAKKIIDSLPTGSLLKIDGQLTKK